MAKRKMPALGLDDAQLEHLRVVQNLSPRARKKLDLENEMDQWDDDDELPAPKKSKRPLRSEEDKESWRSRSEKNWVPCAGTDIDELFERAGDVERHMAPGEVEFINSLKDWAEKRDGLTIRQYGALVKRVGAIEERCEKRKEGGWK